MSKQRPIGHDFEGETLESVFVGRRDHQARPTVLLIPTVMGREVELHPVTLIVALLLCGKLLGLRTSSASTCAAPSVTRCSARWGGCAAIAQRSGGGCSRCSPSPRNWRK